MTTWLHIEPLLAVVLWGGVYPGAKLGLRDIPVLSFTALRILVALVLLFVLAGRRQAWRLPRSLWPLVLRAGLAQAVFQLLLIAGLRWTSAGNSAILLATVPLLTTAWLAVTGRAALTQWQWCGLGGGLVGVGLVVQGSSVGAIWTHLGGDLVALGAAGAWAWYGLVIGPLVGTLGAFRATGWTMVVAACGVIPLACMEIPGQAWQSVSWAAWAGLLYGAVGGLGLAMALWGRAVHRFGPQQTMLYVYLEPVSAVAIAAVVLGEAGHSMQAVGALLTFVGIALASSQEPANNPEGLHRLVLRSLANPVPNKELYWLWSGGALSWLPGAERSLHARSGFPALRTSPQDAVFSHAGAA